MERRAILKKVGAFTAVGSMGNVAATSKSSDEEQILSTRDKRIRDKVRRAFMSHGRRGVKRILEKEGVPHSLAKVKYNAGNKSKDLSPNDYSESNSEFTLGLWSMKKEDRIFAQSLINLNEYGGTPGFRAARFVNDVIGISYNGDHWSRVGTPNKWSDHSRIVPTWYSRSLENGGLAGEVELNYSNVGGQPMDVNCAIETPLENLDGVAGQVWGSYEHTMAPSTGGAIRGITGGAGPLTVDLGALTGTAWDDYDPRSTDGLF